MFSYFPFYTPFLLYSPPISCVSFIVSASLPSSIFLKKYSRQWRLFIYMRMILYLCIKTVYLLFLFFCLVYSRNLVHTFEINLRSVNYLDVVVHQNNLRTRTSVCVIFLFLWLSLSESTFTIYITLFQLLHLQTCVRRPGECDQTHTVFPPWRNPVSLCAIYIWV